MADVFSRPGDASPEASRAQVIEPSRLHVRAGRMELSVSVDGDDTPDSPYERGSFELKLDGRPVVGLVQSLLLELSAESPCRG